MPDGVLRLLALATTLICTACGGGLFACQSDEDCQGGAAAGMCAEAGACSFPDDACESGQRYGDHAGDMSGHCVPPQGTTSGDASTASTVTASSPTSLDVSSSPDDGVDTTDASASTTTPLGTSTTNIDPTTPAESGNDSSTTGTSVDDPDLLVWLRFDEDVADKAIVNHGVLGGYASCVDDCPDVGDGIADYDGLGDCLAFPSDDALVDTPFTVASWVWPDSDDEGMFLFGKAVEASSQNSWEMYIQYELVIGQQLGFEMYGPPDAVIVQEPPLRTQWNHLAGTWDGDVMRLFVDGTAVAEIASPMASFDDHDVRFGCDDDAGVGVYFFEGWMADVRIYGRVLDDLEVAELASTAPAAPT